MTQRSNVRFVTLFLFLIVFVFQISSLSAEPYGGEKTYTFLSKIARTGDNTPVFDRINSESRNLNWKAAEPAQFEGNLRVLTIDDAEDINESTTVYLIRKLSGEVYVLYNPADMGISSDDLKKMSQNRLIFNLNVMKGNVQGNEYAFAQFVEEPVQPLFDRIFKISIVLMLILIMVGMGMTLTIREFALVFKKPRGIFIGQILQFGLMPLLALGLGYISGFHSNYPYIYVGFILIAVSPGGVVSNLMTHYAKGDLALSISVTSFSTVLSLFFTPLLLSVYCKNVPEISIPALAVVLTITILVIIPLMVGMIVRGKWERFAEKATPFFSALGIVAVLFIMVAGIISNVDIIADTKRYGVKFYSMVFLLTMLGMVLGGVIPKLFRISNYQSRAISLETGLRNSALAMTLAILMQDQMGDFYSSMFVVSGVFGLLMFISGLISILMFKRALPVEEKEMRGESMDLHPEPQVIMEIIGKSKESAVGAGRIH